MRLSRLALAALGLACLGAAPLATMPLSRTDIPWWRARHEAKLREAREGRFNLVFLGDSITEQWEQSGPPPWRDYQPVWRQFYGDRRALNLGFKGDATAHLLWRIEHGELDGLSPKVAVILIGANNLGHLHWPAQDDVAGIEAVVAETRRRLPDARIVLLGILPSDRGAWVRQTTAEINGALERRYGGGAIPGVTWMDLSRLFRGPDGRIDPGQFADRNLRPPEPALHPSPEAARRVAEALEPTIAGLLGDRDHGH